MYRWHCHRCCCCGHYDCWYISKSRFVYVGTYFHNFWLHTKINGCVFNLPCVFVFITVKRAGWSLIWPLQGYKQTPKFEKQNNQVAQPKTTSPCVFSINGGGVGHEPMGGGVSRPIQFSFHNPSPQLEVLFNVTFKKSSPPKRKITTKSMQTPQR